jgi:hypothetical protein
VKNRAWIVLLVVSLGVNIGVLLHRFWPRGIAGQAVQVARSQSGWHAAPMRRGLGLNDEQERLMETERLQALAQARPLQDELRLKRRQLFLLLKEKAVAEAELDAALGDISRLQAAIEKIFIRHSLTVKGVLTPEQLRKYDGLFEQGLCPGMMSEKNCPPGKMAGQGMPGPACGDPCPGKK